VQFFTLENQGQSLRMAYMDIRPNNSDQTETVVLLHGKNFSGSYWQKTIKALTGVPPQSTEQLINVEMAMTQEKYRAFIQRYFVKWKPEYETFIETRSRQALSGEFPRLAKANALTFQMIYQQPVRHEFRLLQPPTSLIIGLADRTTVGRGRVPEEIIKDKGQYAVLGKEAAKDIPNCKLVELANVGHIPHLEAPEEFHRNVIGFLKEAVKPTR
jgi:pimeloyl-ACP methyl ester carboxylesterase